MIAPAVVTEVSILGELLRREAEPVVVQVIQVLGIPEVAGEGVRHLLVVTGRTGFATDLAGVRRALWLGRRMRVDGALFELDDGRLRLRDSVLVDLRPVGHEDKAGELPTIQLRAGPLEVELGVEQLMSALQETPVEVCLGTPLVTVH